MSDLNQLIHLSELQNVTRPSDKNIMPWVARQKQQKKY